MDIITKKELKTNNFWLHFKLNDGIGCEFFDEGLPPPNIITHHTSINNNGGVSWAWLLDGYFQTVKGHEYLNDVIARFLITFKEQQIERLPYKPNHIERAILGKAYKLKELSVHLQSISNISKAPQRADSFADYTFWAIKLFAEDEIRRTGFIVYNNLERFALQNFIENKSQSTIKAKCRSVWNYYEKQDFKLTEYIKKPKGEVMATRTENAFLTNEKRKQETEAKIKSAVVYLKEKDLKITAKAISEYTKLNKNTLTNYKHLWKVVNND